MASVLVVEDNLEHQRAIAEIAGRLGHHVQVAGDGRAGLHAIAAERPDLVIADVDMPHLDGLEMCRSLRDQPGTADIPVVLLTAYLPLDDARLAAARPVAVIPKPFGIRDLTAILRSHLEVPPAGDGSAFTEALLQSLDTGVAACDLDGRMVVLNRVVREFFGDKAATVPAPEWARRFRLRHHDGTPLRPEEVPLVRALAGEEVDHADVLAYDRQNRPRWFAINARPVRDPSGALLGALAAIHDVTAEYHQRQYERCQTEVLKVLLHAPDTLQAGTEVLHTVGSCLRWPHLRLWLVDEVTGVMRPVASYTAPDERPVPLPSGVGRGEGLAGLCWERGEPVWVPDVRAPGSPLLAEIAAGSPYLAAGAVPLTSADEVVGVLSFFSHDHQEPEPALAVLLSGIAGHVGAYLERHRAEELAGQLAASIGEYIALVGHELRTPLTSISTYTDLIAESGDDTTIGSIRDLLDVIGRNNARLRSLVERLLDLAALESGHAGLTIGPVDLTAVVREAAAAVGSPAATHPSGTATAVPPADPPVIRTDLPERLLVPGDRARLRQVAENLIGNAIKFSPGAPAVTVTLTAEPDVAVLTIADSGIGIPADEQSRLFSRLYRARNARHSGIPGAGLGLALSRAVVALHGGTISLGPGEHGGTVAVVRLPREDD